MRPSPSDVWTRVLAPAGALGENSCHRFDFAPPVEASMKRFFVLLAVAALRSEEHTSELQSPCNLVCRLLLEKKKKSLRLYTHSYQACALNPIVATPISARASVSAT